LDATNVGDEGGFAPNIMEAEEGLDLIMEAIAIAGYEGKIKIGMDVAAAEFYTEDKQYDLDFKTENNDKSHKISGKALQEVYAGFAAKYPIVSIEDPFDQGMSFCYFGDFGVVLSSLRTETVRVCFGPGMSVCQHVSMFVCNSSICFPFVVCYKGSDCESKHKRND
jgi:hypothetical protein